MEKITKNASKKFPFVKIHLEDIEEIIEILENEGIKDIKLETKDYSFNKNEIKDIKENQISSLRISSHTPSYFYINFNSYEVKIYSEKDTSKALGLIEKIGLILHKKKKTLINLLCSIWFAIIIQLLIITISIIISKKFENETLFFIGMVLSFLIFMTISYFSTKNKSSIVLEYKKDSPNYWIRNKDKIITNLLFTAIGTVIGYFIK